MHIQGRNLLFRLQLAEAKHFGYFSSSVRSYSSVKFRIFAALLCDKALKGETRHSAEFLFIIVTVLLQVYKLCDIALSKQ